MDEALLAAYRDTDYRVRLTRGGWATIRIDQPLPSALRPMAGPHPWAFITAWNPRSEPTPRPQNRAAMRSLLEALRAAPGTVVIRPGLGSGSAWAEPSLWVVGLDTTVIDAFAQRFRQFGYVHGQGPAPAQLRLTPLI
jgi:hypothetical protein